MPFGQVRYLPGSPAITNTDFGYTGQRDLDSEIGLMDYKARFYSPLLGRFVQPDSILPTTQGVQGLNRYTYVNNNPILYNDPSGHCILGCIGDAIVLGAGIGFAIGAGVNLAIQGVQIYKGDQTSLDWGEVAGAAVGGAFMGGGLAVAPVAGLAGVAAILLTGAVAGQVSAVTEAVVDEVVNDGANYKNPDVGKAMFENGFLDPGKMAFDGVLSLASVGAGKALSGIGKSLGILPKTTSTSYQTIQLQYKAPPKISTPKKFTIPQTNSAVAVNEVFNRLVDIMEETLQQSIEEDLYE